MRRNAQRREEIGEQRVRVAEKWREEAPIRGGVDAEVGRRLVQGAAQHHRRLAVERMRGRRGAGRPAQTVGLEREAAEERGQNAGRMTARTDVVEIAGQGERGAAGAAADLGARLDDPDAGATARQLDRRGEPVRPRADDDGVVHAYASP